MLKYVEISNGSVIDLMLKDREGCLIVQSLFNWLKFMLNFSKIRLFFVKNGTQYDFLPNFTEFAGFRHLKTAAIFIASLKKEVYAFFLVL